MTRPSITLPTGQGTGHPLLGCRLPSAHPAWEADAADPRLAFLESHIVRGTPVFPGAAYAEMALAAALQLAPDQSPVLEQLTFREVLLLPDRTDTLLRLRYDSGTNAFEIHSADRADPSAWLLHADGRLATAPGAAPGATDVSGILARCADEIDVLRLYASLAQGGLEYQGLFRGITALRRGGREAIAHLSLAEKDGGPVSFRVHPALLDSAFQAVAALADDLSTPYAPALWLPVMIGRLSWWCDPGHEAWTHVTLERTAARELEADISIIHQDGAVALRVEGLLCRALGGHAGLDATPA